MARIPPDLPDLPAGAADHAALLIATYRIATGEALTDPETVQGLWTSEIPIVSHWGGPDPIFCFANPAALALFEMDWDAFTRLPSRHSAPASDAIQQDRNRLLAASKAQGVIHDYAGLRQSAKGKRFYIKETVLWTFPDPNGSRIGQAARIGRVDPA